MSILVPAVPAFRNAPARVPLRAKGEDTSLTFHCSVRFLANVLLAACAGATLAAQTIQVSPLTVTLSAQVGSTGPVTQTLSVTSSGVPAGTQMSYIAAVTYPSSPIGWLQVSPPAGTAPATVTLSANPTGLQAGTYVAAVAFSGSGATNNPQTVTVTLAIGQLGASPSTLSFNYQSGGTAPAAQTVAISSSAGLTFTTAAATTTGGNWLQVSPPVGSAPGNINVAVDPQVIAALGAGTYNGTVTLTPTTGATTALQLPVALVVTTLPKLGISPPAMTFNYQIGGTKNTIQQVLTLASDSAPINFSLTASVAPNPAGANWLSVTPTSGVTPASLNVGIAPAGLPPGSYTGSISFNAPGTATPTQTVNVTLNVSNNPLLTVAPNALAFTYQIGGAAPAAQMLTPTSTGAEFPYTVTAATEAGGSWLAASPSGTTPAPISVSVSPGSLGVGTYNGTITVTGTSTGNPAQQIPVTLRVTNDPLISLGAGQLSFAYQVGQTAPVPQSVAVASTTGALLNYTVAAATTSGGNWLSVNPTSGTTPGSFTVSASAATPGVYDGTITVTATIAATGAPAPNSPVTIPVKFYVSNSALLNVAPPSLVFNSVGGSLPATQTLSLTSTSATDRLNYSLTFSTTSGGSSWLTVGPIQGQTPDTINVAVNPTLLSAGTYRGAIVITAKNTTSGADAANSPQTIPVTLVVAAGSLGATPASLSFTQAAGGAPPAAQNISVTGTGATLNFTAVAAVPGGQNWLTVAPGSGATPGTVAVTVNGASLSPGNYQGTVTISSPGAAGSPVAIPVALTVTSAQTITVAPASLSFSYQSGGPAPAAQNLQITTAGSPLPFAASAATVSGGNWLKLTPANGNTPGTVAVSVDPTGLAPGNYTGTVSIAAQGASNSPQTVSVALAVAAVPAPSLMAVTNAASFASGPVAPGEIVTLFGTNFGPATLTTAHVTSGMVDTVLADTRVLFDGAAAPLIYVSATQISAVVPYSVAGRLTTRMQVEYKGIVSNSLDIRVTDAAPGIFTLNISGSGPGAVVNQDGITVNSAARPAPRGSIVVLYATGEGQTTPAGVTGKVTPADGSGLAKPLLPVTVLIGGQQAEVLYAGSAPGFVAGALQVNARVPQNAPTGDTIPVLVIVGSASSQANVTMAVR